MNAKKNIISFALVALLISYFPSSPTGASPNILSALT